MDAENLHRRLKKIIGQVQAIDRMVDEDVPCEDILAQINAAKSALHKCGQVVLEGHIKHCVRDGIEHGDADQTIASFTKAVERTPKLGRTATKRTTTPMPPSQFVMPRQKIIDFSMISISGIAVAPVVVKPDMISK